MEGPSTAHSSSPPGTLQPDPNPEFRLPPRPPGGLTRRRPFIGGPRRPNSWRHPGGTVSETEESEFSEAEGGAGGVNEGVGVGVGVVGAVGDMVPPGGGGKEDEEEDEEGKGESGDVEAHGSSPVTPV